MAERTPLLLIALGDSITAGVGGKWNKGYPEHLHQLLQAHNSDLKLVNWGIPGLTINRLTRALKKGEHLHTDLKSATCIVMTICGNDIIGAFKKKRKSKNITLQNEHIMTLNQDLDQLLQTLRSITSCPLYLSDLYNPFPQSAEAADIIETVNGLCLYPLPSRYSGIKIIRVSDVLRGQEADHIQYYDSGTVRDLKKFWRTPIHPNDQGHRIIAQAFYQAITSDRPPMLAKPKHPPRSTRTRKTKRPK